MITIDFAKAGNSEIMRKILEEHLIDIHNPQTLQNSKNNGFLIRNISSEQIEELIADQKNNLVLTAKENEEILGYIISSKFSSAQKQYTKAMLPYLEQRKINPDLTLYYRQIAVKLGTQNIGKSLVSELLDRAKNVGYEHIICKIIHEPLKNHKSIAFHTKFGFNFIDELKEDVVAGLYLCDLKNYQP